MNIPVFDVSSEAVIKQSSSKGNQFKWFLNNCCIKACFRYQDKIWQDNLCEVTAFYIAHLFHISATPYFLCRIKLKDGRVIDGCYSHNFLTSADEHCISFGTILKAKSNSLYLSGSTKERVVNVTALVSEVTELSYASVFSYIGSALFLDYLILNEDRHFNNLVVIHNNKTDVYRLAPVFDNGLSFDLNDIMYDGMSAVTLINKVKSKPFAKRFSTQIHALGIKSLTGVYDLRGIKFPDLRAKQVVCIQIAQLGGKYIV